MTQPNETAHAITVRLSRGTWVQVTYILSFALLVSLYASLMLQDKIPVVGIAILGVLWGIHWLLNGRLSASTPLDFPLLAFLALLPLNQAISVAPEMTQPKVISVVLGILFFYLSINWKWYRADLWKVTVFLLVLSLGVSVLGLITIAGEINLPAPFYSLQLSLAALQNKLIGSGLSASVNPNLIGGALALVLPVLFSLILNQGAFRNSLAESGKPKKIWVFVYNLSLWAVFIFTLLTLLLTSSRGAIVGSVIGLLIVLIWKDRRYFWLIALALLAGFIAVIILNKGNWNEFLYMLDRGANNRTFFDRIQVWTGAEHLIQDFPLTGAGMDTFLKLSSRYYSYASLAFAGAYHPHNQILTMGVEFGLPGIVLYVALLSSAFFMVVRLASKLVPLAKTILIGLISGLIAHQVFGIFDAFMLGTKLGILFWIFLAIITGIYIHQTTLQENSTPPALKISIQAKITPKSVRNWLQRMGLGLFSWLVISGIAVSFVNINFSLSLLLAVLGGILMGAILILLPESWQKNEAELSDLLDGFHSE